MSPLLLVPEATGFGGVQMVSRHLSTAFDRVGGTVLSLNDPRKVSVSVGDRSVEIRGFERDRTDFIRNARRASAEASLVFLAHPHLASIAPALRLRALAILGHGTEAWERLSFLRRLGLRRADAIGAVSDFTLQRMLSLNDLSPDLTFVLNPAVDPSMLSDDVAAISDRPRILSVARLVRGDAYKGIDRVLAVLPSLCSRIVDLEYVIVGDGDDRPRLQRIVEILRLERNVTFTGEVSIERLRELYASATAFVLPSRGEGFGIVFLEAMAFGVPVVGIAEGGAAEALGDGECGLVVDPNDQRGLREAIELLLTDEARRKELGARGRDRVLREFSYPVFEGRTLSLMERLGAR